MGSLVKVLPRFRLDRLWWYLAIICIFSLVGQEFSRSTGYGLAAAAELEGFGDELDEDDDVEPEVEIIPPPTSHPGPQTDRGLPSSDPKVQGSSKQNDGHRQSRAVWDEDEFEGMPQEVAADNSAEEAVPYLKQEAPATPAPPRARRTFLQANNANSNYYAEIIFVVFLVIYGTVYWYGKNENEKIALAWAERFAAREDSIFAKNFSLLGTGSGRQEDENEALLVKEGQNTFKFYASGRRYCEGMLATMDLKNRHDLLSLLWYLISPRKDELTIEVYMSDESMEPFVFGVTRRRQAKVWHKETRDLQRFAALMDVTAIVKKWPSAELAVVTETREAAEELLTDAVIDQVFGERVLSKYGEGFVSMHFSDQSPYGSHKKTLRFQFTLPSLQRLESTTRLMALVPYYIDLVGRFKLSAQARAKAVEARTKVVTEAFREKEKERMEALQKKKEEKKRLEEELRKKMNPEALRKLEEKEKARQLRKAIPKIKLSRH